MRILFAMLLSLCSALPAQAEEKIKLGTLAPNGSPWHTLLKELSQKWTEASGGRVKLIIYAGGTQGNEGEMVKKTRINQLQAVAVSMIGLHEITPEPQAVDVPFMVRTFDELDYVMERIAPRLEKALEQKGYIVLSWSDIGFVRFFSTKRYSTLKEFTDKAKLFGWDGDPASVEAWRAGGFKPVVMSSTDIVPSLQTGLLDTVALPPLYAFTSRMFEKAKYMLDLPWAVLNGATIVRKDAWEKIPADLRPKLMEISRSYSKRIGTEVHRMDEEALATMKSQGLEVVAPADAAAFEKAAMSTWGVIRAKVVPADIFDEIKRYVEEARKLKK